LIYRSWAILSGSPLIPFHQSSTSMEAKLTIQDKKDFLVLVDVDHPEHTLKEFFIQFHPEDVARLVENWRDLSLGNEHSAYPNGIERQRLIRFCFDFNALVEALFCHYKKLKQSGKTDHPTEDYAFLDSFPLRFLSVEEQSNPLEMMRHFFKKYEVEYAKAELLDLLDGALTSEEEHLVKKFQRNGAVLSLKIFYSMVDLAFHLQQ